MGIQRVKAIKKTKKEYLKTREFGIKNYCASCIKSSACRSCWSKRNEGFLGK
jgi:hypothetical protein